MNVSQADLGWLYLCSLLAGVILGAFYDVLRITRVFLGVHYSRRTARALRGVSLPLLKAQKDRGENKMLGIVVFVEDFFFCLFAAVALILLFYEMTNGKFRIFAILICMMGFLLYRGTLGRLVMLCSEVIAFVIETAVRYLAFFILFPLRFCKQKITQRSKQVTTYFKKKQQKRERVRYTAYERARIAENACGMMPQNRASKALKKGKKYARTNEKKTIQSEYASQGRARADRGGVDRCFCKQRDEV